LENKGWIAKVILEHYHDKLDHLFDYEIPENMQQTIVPGTRVKVPFGKGNRLLEAFVIEIVQQIDKGAALKSVARMMDPFPVLTEKQIEMVYWMKQQYLCRTIEAIRCFVPLHRVTQKKRTYVKMLKMDVNADVDAFRAAPVQQRIIDCLKEHPQLLLSELLKKTGAGRSSVKSLENKGVLSLFQQNERRNPFILKKPEDYPEPILNSMQEDVLAEIKKNWQKDPDKPVLLHGITGSGKTEVYLRLIKETLAQNMDSIMLVPEISLTPQMVDRFRGRFGDLIAVLHSHLSEGEKFDEWQRIRNQESRIVIGPRSAIFAPCRNLGMIIVDEEHETTYKSEQSPRYHALEIARLRSRKEDARLLMGSATPSIENYHLALEEKVKLLQMKERINGSFLPEVEIVDMRREIRNGNTTIFSQKMVSEIQACLESGHQAILLLNRRAYATFVSCLHCGFVYQCEDCDISLKWHKTERKLKCHYCGQQHQVRNKCPECGELLSFQGSGTQKAEEGLRELFAGRTIERMDQDVTRQKGSHQEILDRFSSKKIDILIGTQMIAKGHDFPNVTLVGILMADTSLNLPDFRASEKTFQLITQVSGRSGRGAAAGKVVLQTYHPEHYAIQMAAKQDYDRFYQQEIIIRKDFAYPPFTKLIQLNFSGAAEADVKATAEKMAHSMKYLLEQKGYDQIHEIVMGPAPALIGRVENRYRYTILLKAVNVPFVFLKKMVKYLMIDKKDQQIPAEITTTIDTDPRFI
jgi:primosomal protein N' (replication factor Y) (superfamily II helicase)